MSIDGNFHIPSIFPKGGQIKTDANVNKKKKIGSDHNGILSSGINKKGVSLKLVPFLSFRGDICPVCQVDNIIICGLFDESFNGFGSG